jgi:peptidyl-prolyl cis-trans isomerase C
MKSVKRMLSAQGARTGKLEIQARQNVTNVLPHIVEQFVSTTLLKDEATRRGFKATSSDIDKAVNEIVANLPDFMTFADVLEKQGLSLEEARKEIADGLAINKLIEDVTKDIIVDEDAIVKFYEENAPLFERPEQVEASHILIKVDNTDVANAKVDAKAKAESIRRRILQGEDFSELAKAYSDCPSSTQGGNLGLFGRGQMVKPFEEAAFALNKFEISDVVKTEYGYHIIKVTDKKPAGKTPLSEVREQIEKQFLSEKKMETVQKLIDLLKSKADIYVNEHFQKETP